MTADAREAGAQQVANQEKQPIFVGSAVGVSECDERSGGRFDAGVSGGAQTKVLGVPKADDAGEEGGDGRGGIGGTVIHQNDFVIRVIEVFERLEAGLERGGSVVAGDHYRDPGSGRERKVRCDGKLLANRLKGGLRGSV